VRQIWPLSALLLGTAFLLFAGGINGLILPIRGSVEGFSTISLGLLGTGWAIGYVSGCVMTPPLVGRVGHIRAFGVMAAFASVAVLASLILVTPWAWIPLRAVSGFCFAGGAMIVESWISERTVPENRGRVFGLYTMVNLAATTAGQMTLTLGGVDGFLFFVVAAMFYSLALVPTAISSSATPRPLVSVRLDIGALWRNSPLALVAVFLVGTANSAFGTLAAVYADRIGLALTAIALFNSLPILAGAAAQIPVGYFSDRVDRRRVLLAIVCVALVADLGFILLRPEGQAANLVLAALFGAGVFSMYPVIIAHANDHAPPGSYIQVSGGLLLVMGTGSVIGPLVAGFGMASLGVGGLFLTAFAAHLLMLGYVLWRISRRAPVVPGAKGAFVGSPPTRTSTPETMALGATAEEAEFLDAD
jgi:MFS family permease